MYVHTMPMPLMMPMPFVRRTSRRRGMGDALSSLISPAVGLATSAVGIWENQLTLAHNADTATTQIVNGIEPLFNANKNAYLAGPGTCADQAAALAAFDTGVQWMRSPQACGNGSYGSAGNRCISDRLCETGCKFPWIAWYRDPIANDPRAAGCAAALPADAAEQSALANINALTSGSVQQTTPGQFAAGAVPSVDTTIPILSSVPSWVWLAAAGVVVVMILK